jgi:hypothetical protein
VPVPMAHLTVRARDGIWLRVVRRDNGQIAHPTAGGVDDGQIARPAEGGREDGQIANPTDRHA